jgi:hypothetical protein
MKERANKSQKAKKVEKKPGDLNSVKRFLTNVKKQKQNEKDS